MAKKGIKQSISHYLERLARQGEGPVGAQDITAHIAEKRPTVNRYLASLVQDGSIESLGSGPATGDCAMNATDGSQTLCSTPPRLRCCFKRCLRMARGCGWRGG